MTLDQVGDVIIRLGAVAAALAAISLLLSRLINRAVVRPLTKFVQAEVATVIKELKPNGGSSLRDAIDDIAKVQEHQHKENRDLVIELRADVRAAGVDIPEQ